MAYQLAGHGDREAASAHLERVTDARFAPRSFRLDMVSNRSFMPERTNLILLGFGTALGLMSLRFVLLGAWPVAIFALLDLTALGGALFAFRRSHVPAETLTIADGQIVHLAIDARGLERRATMPAYWVRLEAIERSPLDLTLWLRFRGQRHPVGQCLGLDERREVAKLIDRALGGWRP
ncbi:hypothetical protein GCM10009087_53050 [Sphingomonas oligophenolica]|uniref:DUF2244 domain-containing protein n=1 Tax=Sphingomonas oligophenolica TaxID=301154 RepID=A0ABU9Y7F6_9SPHN